MNSRIIHKELLKKTESIMNHFKILFEHLPQKPLSDFKHSEHYVKYLEVTRKLKLMTCDDSNGEIYKREDLFHFQEELCRQFFDIAKIKMEPEELFNLTGNENDFEVKCMGHDSKLILKTLEKVFNQYSFIEIFNSQNNFKNFTELFNYTIANNDFYLCLITVALCSNIYRARENGFQDEIRHFKTVFEIKSIDVKQCNYQNCTRLCRKLVDIAIELNDLGLIFKRDKIKLEDMTFGIRRVYSSGLDYEGKLEKLYGILRDEFNIIGIHEQ